MELSLIAVVAVALFFDFTNGFHDSANAIATTVSTRALSPRLAVLGAAILNFAGAFISLKVASTIGKGIVDSSAITLKVVLAGLVGAIAWNLVTWYLGLPSSSSHALIGGVAGAAIAAAGTGVIKWDGLRDKVLVPSLLAPVIGFLLAALLTVIILWIVRKMAPGPVNRVFRRLVLVSGGFVALTHGTNDAQKTMGVIALALVAAHPGDEFGVPTWVIISAATAIAIGTYAGGWRIIKTLGQRVTKLDPPQGFAAQTSTATILYLTAHFGYPVSTTHTISGGVLGAGATSRLSAVRWGVAGNILLAWVFTIPCAALVGGGMEILTRVPGIGVALVFAVAVGAALVAFRARSTQGGGKREHSRGMLGLRRPVPAPVDEPAKPLATTRD
jgi:inorganic phosphate transporter, PiT family